jgi:hypothetical protein
MLTTGFKLYFGFFLTTLFAAVVYGYTTGGNGLGPISVGYKGGVGDHLGYGILLVAAACWLLAGLMLVAFRDADPRSLAELLGTDQVPAQKPTGASYWPLVGALGVGIFIVGVVTSHALAWLGVVVLLATAVEWMMQAWADRATGDPAVNSELRNRLMQPFEIPIAAAGMIAVLVLAFSRVFLAASKENAVWIALGVLVAIVLIAVAVASRPKISKNAIAAVVLVAGIAVVGGGIAAAKIGPREFEKEGTSAPKPGLAPKTTGSTTTTAAGGGK